MRQNIYTVIITLLIALMVTPPMAMAQDIGPAVSHTFRDINVGVTVGGLWRVKLLNGTLAWDMNTAANGGFGTTNQYVLMTGGAVTVLGGLKMIGTSLVFQTNGVSGTINWAPSTTAKSITFPNGSTDFTATGGTSQVVKQTTAGGALSVARLACADLSDSSTGCSSGGSSTTVRYIPNVAQEVVVSTGAPVTSTLSTSATVIQMPNAADSAVVTSFVIPPDLSGSTNITLDLNYTADSAPGATNNKVKLKIACTDNGTATAYTASDTITLANNTTPAQYTATNNTCNSVTAGHSMYVVIYRDVSVANNAAVAFDIMAINFRYTSIQ